MKKSVVRQSKFRHVFGATSKKDIWENLKVGTANQETTLIRCNKKFFATPWVVGGGGCMCVWPLSKPGKLPDTMNLVHGHSAPILDFDLSTFDEHLLATGSEDTHVKIWRIPDEEGIQSVSKLETFELDFVMRRRVVLVDFHPFVQNLLITHSPDGSVRFTDVNKGEEALSFTKHQDTIFNISWKWSSDLFVSASRDRKARICDARSDTITAEFEAHEGAKGIRAVWMGDTDRILTVGFNKRSERQLKIWDINKTDAPIAVHTIDVSNGVITPFYDAGTGIVMLSGRGDRNISYYETTNDAPYLHQLSEYSSPTVQKSIVMMHKTTCDIKKNEFVKFLKLTVNNTVETLGFTIPRKSEYFQDDIFPDFPAYGQPTCTAEEWVGGATNPPPLESLRPPGMTAQSEVVVEQQTGPKYNFKEEVEKAELSKKTPQQRVFEQFYSHISDAADDEDVASKNKHNNDDDGW